MSRRNIILGLNERLKNAIGENSWDELAKVDSEIAALLARLPGEKALSAAELHEISRLYRTHREASERCSREMHFLSNQMQEMQNKREGLLAYSQHSNNTENF